MHSRGPEGRLPQDTTTQLYEFDCGTATHAAVLWELDTASELACKKLLGQSSVPFAGHGLSPREQE